MKYRIELLRMKKSIVFAKTSTGMNGFYTRKDYVDS